MDKIYVINLPARSDRRDEIAAQFRRVGLGLDSPQVSLFPAVRPTETGLFPSIGARGCFLSHLGVLRDAAARKYRQILILEDDADFARPMLQAGADVVGDFYAQDWGMAYLGHRIGPLQPVLSGLGRFAIAPPEIVIETTHAMLLRKDAILGLVLYLEAGDPAGGPMHLVAAYSRFCGDHPKMRTVLTREQWVVQRASRTDIAENGWKENIPFIEALRRLCNHLGLK